MTMRIRDLLDCDVSVDEKILFLPPKLDSRLLTIYDNAGREQLMIQFNGTGILSVDRPSGGGDELKFESLRYRRRTHR